MTMARGMQPAMAICFISLLLITETAIHIANGNENMNAVDFVRIASPRAAPIARPARSVNCFRKRSE